MKKPILMIVSFALVGAALFYFSKQDISSNVEVSILTSNNTIAQSDGLETNAEGALTVNEVKKHNSLASCWSIINGTVYDLTEYAPRHAGGAEEIALICGKDGSSLFESVHGGDSKPAFLLKTMELGALVN